MADDYMVPPGGESTAPKPASSFSCGQYLVDRTDSSAQAHRRRGLFGSAMFHLVLVLLRCAAVIVVANALFEGGEDLQDLDVAVFKEARTGKVDEDQLASGNALVILAITIFVAKAVHVTFFDPTLCPAPAAA
jgi:hypothetical protein